MDVRLRVVPVTLKINLAAHWDRSEDRENSVELVMASTLWCSPVISRAGVPAAISWRAISSISEREPVVE